MDRIPELAGEIERVRAVAVGCGSPSGCATCGAFRAWPLSILDPDNPYRYLTIRGPVVKITEDGAVEHINAFAKKYRGCGDLPQPQPWRSAGHVHHRAPADGGGGARIFV